MTAMPPANNAMMNIDKKDANEIRALLIDIDDTLVRFKTQDPQDDRNSPNTGSLAEVLQRAGVELAGLTAEETARRIARIKREVSWWHWSDFIVELGLRPKAFWDFAYAVESAYLEPTGDEILPALLRLKEHGILLYITSNNPSSGILHKLRLAGVAHVNGTTLFSQLLGGTELQAMKWEPIYWKKVLAHIALDAGEVAVVGDNPRDDYEVPHSIGIRRFFLIDRFRNLSASDTGTLTHVQNFNQIADQLLRKR